MKSGGTGKTPQPEAKRKQAGWGENAGTEKTPQPEADRKQAGWVKWEKSPNRKLRGIKRVGAKMFKQEEILQSERVENQADWG